MASKTTIDAAIALRADAGDNPISTERDLWELLTEELFATVSPDSQSLQSYTTKANNNWTYAIKLKKQGNVGYMTGVATKITGSTSAGLEVFTWKANQYKPLAGLNTRILKTEIFTGGNVGNFVFDENGLTFTDTVVIGNTYNLPMITYWVPDTP